MEQSELEQLINLSSAGSVEASFKLSDYYLENGKEAQSFDVLNRLNKSENKDVYRRLGYLYQKGIGTIQNIEEAIFYYNKACELGDEVSEFNLALIYYQNKEFDKALPHLLVGQANNHLNSIKMLAEFYQKGYSVDINLEIAKKLYEKVLSMGDTSVLFILGVIEQKLLNDEVALSYFLKCIDHNDLRGYIEASNCYLTGKGTIKNIERGMEILKAGAEKNDERCIKQLSSFENRGVN
ncbi:MAG: sel1 repeat family protein [Bacilli bacterium]|nr:sel1 repeat family protein [Bacilli bacterium]